MAPLVRSKKSAGRKFKHERMVLSGKDRDAFVDALSNPPAPARKLITALKRHRQLFSDPECKTS